MKIKIKVTFSTEDGEVLEHFFLERAESPVVNSPAALSNVVKERLEQIYDTEDI